MKHSSHLRVLLLLAGAMALLPSCCKKNSVGEQTGEQHSAPQTQPAPQPEQTDEETVFTTPSNCFIVSRAGTYKFPAKKPNNYLDGDISTVSVLWETFGTATQPSVGDVVGNVSYADGYIRFSTPATLKDGNALIAAKNAEGTILWSWHIWVCGGYDPTAKVQVYKNEAGTMMDRNLGATSATPGDAGANGLMYQWGRKDPFPGSSSITANSPAASTLSNWPVELVNEGNGTIVYAVENPTTLIKMSGSTQQDWLWGTSLGGLYYDGNDRWGSGKTIYDPCPAGWRVPDLNFWAKTQGLNVSTTDTFNHSRNSSYNGHDFTNSFGEEGSSTIWYPCCGRIGQNGTLIDVDNNDGYYWTNKAERGLARHLVFGTAGTMVYVCAESAAALGCAVRCVRE